MLLSDPSSLTGTGEAFWFALVQWDFPLSGNLEISKPREYTKLLVEWDEPNQSTGEMGQLGHQSEAVPGQGSCIQAGDLRTRKRRAQESVGVR